MPTFELSTQSAGAATPGRLRLVKPVTLAADALGAPRVPAVMVLSLRSFEPGVDRVRVSVLTSLFAQLREGERIEFVHHLCRGKADGACYALTVAVAAHADRHEALADATAQALTSAYPAYYLVGQRAGGAAAEIPAEALCHHASIQPAGLKVCERPAPSHIALPPASRLGWWSSTATGHPAALPFPEDLPSWALTEPLVELPNLPASVELRIVVEGFAVPSAEQERLHRMLHRIEGGALAVYHPQSAVTAYSAAHELQEPALHLARQWLCHPKAHAVTCLVGSSAALDANALSRIAADVFGRHPTTIRHLPHGILPLLPKPELFQAMRPSQGLPGLLPGLGVLPMLGVARHFARPLVAPPQTGTWLGHSLCGHHTAPVGLPLESRSRHVMLVGGSGTGKSSLLLQMMAHDIAHPAERVGCALLDPHGDLTDRVLDLVPRHRADDVIVIDVTDPVSTVGMNPLEGMRDNPVHAQFVVNELMALVEMLFEGRDTSGPMLRSNLRHLLLLAAWTPNRHGSLLDAMRILEDGDYRDYLLGKCADRTVVEYWGRFTKARGAENGFDSWVPYLMARLTPFTGNPILKRLICRPDSSLDLARAMNEGRIVLFKLNKSVLQDNEAQLLGALVMTRFFSAALGRAAVPESQRTPFHLYIDEAQSFLTDSFPRMLSEARKYGLCITTAHQNIGQLRAAGTRGTIVDALLANTATKFLFRLGPADQETMQPYYKARFEAGQMAALPDFTAVACMVRDNSPIPAFALRVAAPDSRAPDPELVRHILRRSRERYGTPIAAANAELAHTFDLSPLSLGAARTPR